MLTKAWSATKESNLMKDEVLGLLIILINYKKIKGYFLKQIVSLYRGVLESLF